MSKFSQQSSYFNGPLLNTIKRTESVISVDSSQYPFSLNIIKNLKQISLIVRDRI